MVDRSRIPNISYGSVSSSGPVISESTDFPTSIYYFRGDQVWKILQFSAITDILFEGLSNEDILLYNSTTNKWENQPLSEADMKVAVDSSATSDYLGTTSAEGVFRVDGTMTYLDGGNFITIGVDTSVVVDNKVAIDAVATAGYLGAVFNDGVLRTNNTITYTDGGDFITLSVPGDNVDHGLLAGLGDDDHPRYVDIDGTRDLTGDWTISTNDIQLTAGQVRFRDATIYIESADAGHLDLIAGTSVDVNTNTINFGTNVDTDVTLNFLGDTNDGVIYWREDDNEFEIGDDILMTTSNQITFRDAAIYIRSANVGHLDINANTIVDINSDLHVTGDIDLTIASYIQFRDAAIFINSNDDGHLDLTADVSIDLNAPVEIDGILFDYDAVNTWMAIDSNIYLNGNSLILEPLAPYYLEGTGDAYLLNIYSAGDLSTDGGTQGYDLGTDTWTLENISTDSIIALTNSYLAIDFTADANNIVLGNNLSLQNYAINDVSALGDGTYTLTMGVATWELDTNLKVDGNLIIGDGVAATDYTLTFDGETSDGVITWMEDEDYFLFADTIFMNGTKRIFFNDSGSSVYYDGTRLHIYDSTGVQLTDQLLVTGQGAPEGDITIQGLRPDLLFDATECFGGVAYNIVKATLTNTDPSGPISIGAIGVYGNANQGVGDPTGRYMYLDARPTTAYNSNTIKIDVTNKVGIALSSSNRPSEALHVNGNILIGTGAAGIDYVLKFDGETSDLISTWMEDEGQLKMEFPNILNTGLWLKPADTGLYTGLAGLNIGSTAAISGRIYYAHNLGNMYINNNYNNTAGIISFNVKGTTNILNLKDTGVLIPSDTVPLILGAGGDASIKYDGTDMVITTDLVAASDFVIDCGTNKTLELTEPVYKDINAGALNFSGPPGLQPDIENFVDEAGADTGIATYGVAIGQGFSGSFEIQHDYKEGTDIVFHVHWQGIAAPSGTDNVQWRLTYTLARDGATLDAVTIVDSADTAFDTQYESVRTDFTAITGTNFLIGDQFLFTLERVAATGDAYAGDALVETVGIHYQVNTIGSRTVTVK